MQRNKDLSLIGDKSFESREGVIIGELVYPYYPVYPEMLTDKFFAVLGSEVNSDSEI